MPTRTEQIILKTIEILKDSPEGVRYSELVRRVNSFLPDIPKNTIDGAIWKHFQNSEEVYKPARGLYRHISFRAKDELTDFSVKETKFLAEEDFYKPFADYLVKDLGECTKAISLGGNTFKDKWGTPDVIGINESNRSDIIKHETEIISAEIKIDDSQLITAFGQACAYKSFSHKVYIVVPKKASEEDKARLESLCLIFGIGLILLDSSNKENPLFEIRVRPRKHEPDTIYINKYLKLIEKELFS